MIGFLSYLRSKIAHQTYQFRDSLHMERKNQIFKEIWFYLNEKFFALKIISFFTLFALSNPSINTKQDAQHKGRNPSPCTNPYFAKFFQESWKFEFCFPALFSLSQAFNRVLRVSMSKYTSLVLIKTAWIDASMIIHLQFFLDFAFYYSACFNRF